MDACSSVISPWGRKRAVRSKVGGGRGGARLAERVSASLLSVHVCRSFDPLDSQEDGIVTAKLRPKKDSDCRSFWSSAFVQTAFCQEGFQGEDEPERAFQVESPQAIIAVPCEVEFGCWLHFSRTTRTSIMWTTWRKTRPRRASFAHAPTCSESHEAIKKQNSVSLQDIDARNIDIYLQEARSPRLLFLLAPSLPILAGWKVATRQRRIDLPA